MADELKCENLECEDYDNGYCWGYGLPVDDVKECYQQSEEDRKTKLVIDITEKPEE